MNDLGQTSFCLIFVVVVALIVIIQVVWNLEESFNISVDKIRELQQLFLIWMFTPF